MNFPSKKGPLGFFAFVAVFVLGFSFPTSPPGAPAEPQNTKAAAEVRGEDTLKDTDGDGLKDWEESLWHTNLRAADSDSDGTPDGMEVTNNRDPLKKGPEDTIALPAPTAESGTKLSATDYVAQNVFGNYVKLKQAGLPLDEETQTAILNVAVKGVTSYPTPKQFQVTALTITNDESAAALRIYGNALGDLIRRYGKPDVDQELVIVYEALETNDAKKLADLAVVAKSYSDVITALLKTPVPKGAAGAHLALINSASATASAIAAMQYIFNDPVIALEGLRNYHSSSEALGNALATLDGYMEKHRIIFAAYEPGSAFFP